ncbi:DoxX family protein [Candidatus Woesearchaeota archaeon]|nr:DoxX family protein [Candidatus Woesearchaeota archaeon]
MEILDITLLIIRLIIGTFFIVHGYNKFADTSDMAKWLEKYGYKPPMLWVSLIIIAELVGGIGLIIGLGTRLFALMMSAVMLQGIYHRKQIKELKFVDGWEINYVTLASTIALILLGSGIISLDYLLRIQGLMYGFFP